MKRIGEPLDLRHFALGLSASPLDFPSQGAVSTNPLGPIQLHLGIVPGHQAKGISPSLRLPGVHLSILAQRALPSDLTLASILRKNVRRSKRCSVWDLCNIKRLLGVGPTTSQAITTTTGIGLPVVMTILDSRRRGGIYGSPTCYMAFLGTVFLTTRPSSMTVTTLSSREQMLARFG